MRDQFQMRFIGLILLVAMLCSGCQHFIPAAPGLTSVTWPSLSYQRQDQVEVQWKDKSFSFLLYQQQNGSNLQLIALSLTGQQLFQLSFDGQHVIVEQRIDQMKLLPFDYLLRDILYATYPDYKTQAHIKYDGNSSMVFIQDHLILNILKHKDLIELNNIQVPYQMTISPITEVLEHDGGGT
ncbi:MULTISPECIES: DUF3261 domain-containing protein [unclassified Acinetobacter]|uniref:DUF3261 domain-containing protein n=1 Tax=unclassified Acinetobacter TaxID=196816 RepID=UPI002934A2F2|nr:MULTISPECIES: DUF3261 domain-containing protein [unclassified Acinetobacter]WOE31257.1 DUF3261 domain-containing protein [Acinetobacter sp. SAAs470]WOE39453.1 DUF3261 domain-containing protein [Acinetobacter sp. SAAs474]